MATIKCPDPHYQGTVGSITFRDGVAVTEDLGAIAFCRAAGYEVVDEQATSPEPAKAPQRTQGPK